MATGVQSRASRAGGLLLACLAGLAGLGVLGRWVFRSAGRIHVAIISGYVGVMLVGIALVVGMIAWERRHPPVIKRPGGPDKDSREAHLDALRDGLRSASQPLTRVYRARIHEQVRRYVRSGAGWSQDGTGEGPLLFVVHPDGGEPYWIRCNRLVEAEKYCRRQHSIPFEIAPWTLPEPSWSQVRLVDLIG